MEWLEFVRQEYPLAKVTFVRDLGGNYNLNLQVSTAQGALVVRVSPEWVSADRLAAVQAVRGFLRGRGWPIPQTVLTRSGRGFAELHDRLVEVEQYVEPVGTSMTNWPAIAARIDDLALTLFFVNDHLGRNDTSPTRIARLRTLVDCYDVALTTPLSPTERAALPYAVLRTPLTFLRDLSHVGASSRRELTTLRGPQYEWALQLLRTPEWRTAFS